MDFIENYRQSFIPYLTLRGITSLKKVTPSALVKEPILPSVCFADEDTEVLKIQEKTIRGIFNRRPDALFAEIYNEIRAEIGKPLSLMDVYANPMVDDIKNFYKFGKNWLRIKEHFHDLTDFEKKILGTKAESPAAFRLSRVESHIKRMPLNYLSDREEKFFRLDKEANRFYMKDPELNSWWNDPRYKEQIRDRVTYVIKNILQVSLRNKLKHNSTLSYYEKHSLELIERYENADVDDLHKRLLKTFTGCSSILDIGCGREAAFLVLNGFDVVCVDGSAEMVKHAEQAHPELKGKIEQRIMPDDFPADTAFDGVCAVAFFMHLSFHELKTMLENVFHVLKPNGKLFFSVPLTRPDLTESGTDSSGRYFLILSEDKWEKTAADSGFIILDTFTSRDGMGRKNITWFTCTAKKPA